MSSTTQAKMRCITCGCEITGLVYRVDGSGPYCIEHVHPITKMSNDLNGETLELRKQLQAMTKERDAAVKQLLNDWREKAAALNLSFKPTSTQNLLARCMYELSLAIDAEFEESE